jgi:hypothetical protein
MDGRNNKKEDDDMRLVEGTLRHNPTHVLKPEDGSPNHGFCERMANLGRLARIAGGGYMLPEFGGGKHGGSMYDL